MASKVSSPVGVDAAIFLISASQEMVALVALVGGGVGDGTELRRRVLPEFGIQKAKFRINARVS